MSKYKTKSPKSPQIDGQLSEESRLGAVVQRGGSNDFENRCHSANKETLVLVNAADFNKNHLQDWTDDTVKVGAGETVTAEQLEVANRYDLWLQTGYNVSAGDTLVAEQGTGALKPYSPVEFFATDYSYTVGDEDSPEGNPIYLDYDKTGTPYLTSNISTDTENKYISFGDIVIEIYHDSSASGAQVYLNEGSDAGERLEADLSSESDTDEFIDAINSVYGVSIINNTSASSDGVAVNYDDATDEQLEAETNGDADVDIFASVQKREDDFKIIAEEDLNNTSGTPSRIMTRVKG